MIVIDASAVLAMLLDEPGGDRVAAALADGVVSTVNLAEVAERLGRGLPPDEVAGLLASLPLVAIAPDEPTALAAGGLRHHPAAAGLSLADRFCLALGRRIARPVLTADRAWARIAAAVGVEVRLIR